MIYPDNWALITLQTPNKTSQRLLWAQAGAWSLSTDICDQAFDLDFVGFVQYETKSGIKFHCDKDKNWLTPELEYTLNEWFREVEDMPEAQVVMLTAEYKKR